MVVHYYVLVWIDEREALFLLYVKKKNTHEIADVSIGCTHHHKLAELKDLRELVTHTGEEGENKKKQKQHCNLSANPGSPLFFIYLLFSWSNTPKISNIT